MRARINALEHLSLAFDAHLTLRLGGDAPRHVLDPRTRALYRHDRPFRTATQFAVHPQILSQNVHGLLREAAVLR